MSIMPAPLCSQRPMSMSSVSESGSIVSTLLFSQWPVSVSAVSLSLASAVPSGVPLDIHVKGSASLAIIRKKKGEGGIGERRRGEQ